MQLPAEKQPSGLSPDRTRAEMVAVAALGWISRLIDLSRRNNLLYYRPVQGGTIEIAEDSVALVSLLGGNSVPAQSLLSDPLNRPGRVLQIARKSIENLEEKGLQTLYLAVGFASWTAEDGGRDVKAPVFLVPLAFKVKGKDLSAIEIQIAGEPDVNPVLLHVLESQFDLHVEASDLLDMLAISDRETNSPQEQQQKSIESSVARGDSELDRFAPCFAFLASRAEKVPGFTTQSFSVISNFSFQKLAMVNDLKQAGGLLTANDVVAAIAGDVLARVSLGSSQIEVDPHKLDAQAPDQEFCVVEADSSQQCAIAGITIGQSAVVHGPPGTGKSQTITNLIATLIANGKTVLFVAEKRAALEVVQKRLKASGLDHLAIDLHGAELSSKKVMERIARTLNTIRDAGSSQTDDLHRQFVDRRSRLNGHDNRMHRVSERTGKTLYEMQGLLLRLPDSASTGVRWRGSELSALSPQKAVQVRDLLNEAAGYESLFTRQDSSPWTGASFQSGEAVQHSTDAARQLAHEVLPSLAAQLKDLAQVLGFRRPGSLTEVSETVSLLDTVHLHLERYTPEIFTVDLSMLIAALTPGKDGGLKALWFSLVNAPMKEALKKTTALRKGSKAGARELYCELIEIGKSSELWRQRTRGNSIPEFYPGKDSLAAVNFKAKRLTLALHSVISQTGWDRLDLGELSRQSEALAADTTTPYRILRLNGIENQLQAIGIPRLLQDFRSRRASSSIWVQAFDFAWLHSALDEEAIRDPEVRSFVGATHTSYVADFKQLDSDRLKAATVRVRRIHAERTIAAMNANPEQEQLIKQEAAKSRRHKPLRHIFKDAREVMTSVCPCWMASPLSVSQLIDRAAMFDYVIFDEASQILPEDAIPAIMRGKHIVVAGDNKQLPPTGFFSAGAEEEESADEEVADGYESLLDMMLPFAKSFHLNWHYRSKDEALIAFSNHHIYGDRLVTFPGPGESVAITHVLVDQLPGTDGQEDSSGPEVQKVVQLVLEHAHNTPARTLGVITMGIKHAMRIQAALDRALSTMTGLSEFFDAERPERFFIKNLERVQGDERDSIILSVGYGKDRAGHLPLHFGPILSVGGRRRLNVAVTRAKETMTVVSSFVHTDIDITKVRPETGLDFLRNYLQYAASNGKIFSRGELTHEPMNDFETDVFETLTAKGILLMPQLGCSKFRLDFAACHPSHPGKFVLAIECDGASYHSSYTARDRDRLRQQVLENLGWTFHRIWSTDWFNRKHEEVDRVIAAFEKAVSRSEMIRDLSTLPTVPKLSAEGLQLPMVEPTSLRCTVFPPISKRSSITDYSREEMKALHDWVSSDGKLRTHDEIADEMFSALPFARRGARIEAVLREAIARGESSKRAPK